MYCYLVNSFSKYIPINRKFPISESQLTKIHCTTVLFQHNTAEVYYDRNLLLAVWPVVLFRFPLSCFCSLLYEEKDPFGLCANIAKVRENISSP